MEGNLGPQFDHREGLFHGTHHALQGDRILPAAKINRPTNFPKSSDKHSAYASANEETAWRMAGLGQVNYQEKTNKVPGRTKVHVVKPHPEMKTGRYHLSEWKAPHFEVEREVNIQPGMQGTFPEINWNEHQKNPSQVHYGDGINHPMDSDIEAGHEGSNMNQQMLHTMGRQWAAEVGGEAKERKDKVEAPEQGRLF